MLPNKEEQFEDIQNLLQQSYSAPALSDKFTQQLEERLQTLLSTTSQPSEPARTRNRMSQRISGFTMRQRFVLGGVGMVAVLAILLLWLGGIATPVSAMEKMAESIRQAKSFKAAITMEGPFTAEAGKPPVTEKTTGTLYWLAPESTRFDFKHSFIPKPKAGIYYPEDESIIFIGYKMLTIDHKEKQFSRLEAKMLNRRGLEGEIIEKLGEFSGQADRELGTKDIGGKKARGFEIDFKKLFKPSDGYHGLEGMAEIWIDTNSSLPVVVQLKSNTNQAATENAGMTQIKDFLWNIDLDLKMFKPPEGYKDIEPSDEWKIRNYTEALRLFAEWTGGRYPQKLDAWDVFEEAKELYKINGFEYPSVKVQPEMKNNEKLQKVQRIVGLLCQISSFIKLRNEDAAYYGKTVEPKDKDKVLLRWKLDDGRYEVIFGNLQAETVTAEKLHSLEGK
jgi:hypothetical protein